MGEVYEARHLGSGQPVAVKLLHPRYLGDRDLLRRFRREASHASALRHPNSVLILESSQPDGAGAADAEPYIVMELLRGRDLAAVLRDEGALDLPRIVHIVAQVLSAIGEAHALGIVHRDLKPSNIMLIERDGTKDFVKVCDFGIAKVLDDRRPATDPDSSLLTDRGMLCGTPEYMAPEQARAEAIDGRTDLYATSVIMYQMVTGELPFRAPSAMGVLARQITDAPPWPSALRPDRNVPADLERLILRGLSKDPALRPQTAGELRAALLRVGQGLAAAAVPVPVPGAAAAPATQLDLGRPPQLPRATGRRGFRRKALPAVAAVLGGALILALAGGLRLAPLPAADKGGERAATAAAAPTMAAATPPAAPPAAPAETRPSIPPSVATWPSAPAAPADSDTPSAPTARARRGRQGTRAAPPAQPRAAAAGERRGADTQDQSSAASAGAGTHRPAQRDVSNLSLDDLIQDDQLSRRR